LETDSGPGLVRTAGDLSVFTFQLLLGGSHTHVTRDSLDPVRSAVGAQPTDQPFFPLLSQSIQAMRRPAREKSTLTTDPSSAGLDYTINFDSNNAPQTTQSFSVLPLSST